MIWCFDPGETTGVFLGPPLMLHGQILYGGVSSYLYSLLETQDTKDELPEMIVIEQTNIFDRRASKARKNLLPTLEVQGFIVLMAQLYGVPTTYQWNRDKNQVTDAVLDERGILMKPKTKWRHANDAARHYVYYMNRKL